jgi:tRNA(fMet)-specific endonuclease VapC
VKFLLDTNACIGHLTGRAPPITERLKTLSPSSVVLCSIVKAELRYGAH